MTFRSAVEHVGKVVDGVGVAAIVVGVVIATVLALARRHESGPDRYRDYRQRLGKAILLGLELLVAADIIRTVAVSPTFETAGVLAIIVLIRTALSFSLEVELEGHWPWARPTTGAPATTDGQRFVASAGTAGSPMPADADDTSGSVTGPAPTV